MAFVFEPQPPVGAAVTGTSARFPVHRIYCVGRNYADHIREMGFDPAREPPFFFQKPAGALTDGQTGVPYPAHTADLQYEAELVIAIGKGGSNIAQDAALEHVFGYAVGVDMTRRDRQIEARNAGRPWEVGKSFDHSAPMGPIHPVEEVGHLDRGRIWLTVNGVGKQEGDLGQMIWKTAEIVSILSGFFALVPGDLIFTGTPAGVGPVIAGDRVEVGVEGLSSLGFRIG